MLLSPGAAPSIAAALQCLHAWLTTLDPDEDAGTLLSPGALFASFRPLLDTLLGLIASPEEGVVQVRGNTILSRVLPQDLQAT